jgi:two-component system, OmpR family, sensor kinase
MTSLRGRLLAWLLVLLTAMGVVAGGVAYMLDRNEVDGSLDGQLRQVAMNVGDTDFPVSTRLGDGVALDPEDAFVVTIWDHTGQLHSSDPSLRPSQPTAPGYSDFEMAGEQWRAYTQIDPGRTIQVAQRMVVRDEFATESALRAILPFAALVPLSWLLVGWGVARVLRPLRAVTSELRSWGKSGTNALSLEGIPDEILPLALATNELVTRLQTQLEFRERFISDAAHELRTPLTALRLQAKNLSGTAASSEQAALIAEMTNGVRRMSDMVGKLLQLARADSSLPARNAVVVDLGEAIVASLQPVMPIAAEKEIDIGMVESSSEKVLADPGELRTLIGNLIENAVRYTGKGGVIDLSVERTTSEIVLEVRDTGPGIPEEILDRVFARFVRGAGSDIEGSGLGLPIVRAMADRCGARVSLINRQDRNGLIARVVFGAIVPAPVHSPAIFLAMGR